MEILPDRTNIAVTEKIESTGAAEQIALLCSMRADNASRPKKKVNRAFCSELADENAWFAPIYSPEKERIDEQAEEKKGRNESWHTFETP